jgi:tetratricopeptide (TPR) repeat protein
MWLLVLAGSFLPGPLAWGFHFLAYLPVPLRLLYALAGLAGLVLLTRDGAAERAGELLAKASALPVQTLAGAVLAFIAVALALRVAVPLLGDSFIAIKLYENRAAGPAFLPNSHYPAAFFYFFTIMRWLGTFTYPRIMDAFLAGELALGAGYVAILWYLTGALFENARTRTASFLLLLVLPAMQIFFGYVEIYAVSMFFQGLYLLSAALFLKRRAPFYAVTVAFLLLVLSHYLNLLLLPSLLYLAALAYRRDGANSAGIGAAAAAGVALALFSASGVEFASLLPAPRHSPFLSVGAAEDIYQAYPLFSPFHAFDLANLLISAAPAGAVLLVFGLRKEGFTGNPAAVFLASAVIPVVAFFAVAKFDLPMAQDWDIPAPYTLAVTLLGLVLLRDRLAAQTPRVILALALVTALNSFAWFTLNASTQPSLERAAALIDKRISSQDGTYQSTLHFVEYNLARGDTAEVNKAFERFLAMYPADKRGYANYTLHLMQFGEREDAKIRALFERWMELDPAGGEPKDRYADFLLDIGHRDYKEGSLGTAESHFEEAIRLNPAMAEAYNGLGVIARRNGNLDRAIAFYEKAAALDSVNAYAFINLGNLYDDRGASDRAIAYYRKAIALQPNAADAYFNLGVTYARSGDSVRSLEAVRQAARLGMRDAQSYLASKGERW